MSKRDVVVLSAVRSAIGTFGGSLADIEPHELGGTVMKEAVVRSKVDPNLINYVTCGNTLPTDSRFPFTRPGVCVAKKQPSCFVSMQQMLRWSWPMA